MTKTIPFLRKGGPLAILFLLGPMILSMCHCHQAEQTAKPHLILFPLLQLALLVFVKLGPY